MQQTKKTTAHPKHPRRCSTRWLNAWAREEDSSMSREKSASASVSIMDSKMDRLSWCVLRAGRGLSKSATICLPTAKELTQQVLEGENHSIKKKNHTLFLIQYIFVKNGQSPTECIKQTNRWLCKRCGPLTISRDFILALWVCGLVVLLYTKMNFNQVKLKFEFLSNQQF